MRTRVPPPPAGAQPSLRLPWAGAPTTDMSSATQTPREARPSRACSKVQRGRYGPRQVAGPASHRPQGRGDSGTRGGPAHRNLRDTTLPSRRSDAVASVDARLDESVVVGHAGHWPRVAGEYDDRGRAGHGVDGAPLEPELGEIGAREHGVGVRQAVGRGGRALTTCGRPLRTATAALRSDVGKGDWGQGQGQSWIERAVGGVQGCLARVEDSASGLPSPTERVYARRDAACRRSTCSAGTFPRQARACA